jgi:hypothetical protein
MPSFFCICSSVTPFVSGKTNNTTKKCATIIAVNKPNGAGWLYAMRHRAGPYPAFTRLWNFV